MDSPVWESWLEAEQAPENPPVSPIGDHPTRRDRRQPADERRTAHPRQLAMLIRGQLAPAERPPRG